MWRRLWWWGLKDRFGIGWRKEIASSILQNLNKFDLLEIIIDDYLHVSSKELEQIKFLSSQIDLCFHGVSLGLASSLEVDKSVLKLYKKFLSHFKTNNWSEHIAFVRGKDIEVFHLAMPAFKPYTLDYLNKNLEIVYKKIGSYPILENTAALFETPTTIWTEKEWLIKILENPNIYLLLDLHNLYANSVNLKYDPFELIATLPKSKIKSIHLAGGKRVGEKLDKVLDTHRDPVPKIVFDLLEFTLSRNPDPLEIIIERDGNYPDFQEILFELEKAKEISKKSRDKWNQAS
jgi:uncharacterized protein